MRDALNHTRARSQNAVKSRRKYVLLTPSQLIAAIKGSRGIINRIAANSGASWGTIYNILRGKTRKCRAWDRVREAYEDECNSFDDDAEDTIQDAMGQRMDIATAARTAIAYVKLRSRMRRRGWVDQTHIVHDGGSVPIQMQHQVIDVDLLPLELRKQILELVVKKQLGPAQPAQREKDDSQGDDDEQEIDD